MGEVRGEMGEVGEDVLTAALTFDFCFMQIHLVDL